MQSKKKIITVVGARPQIIKASVISRSIAKDYSNELNEIIVHTGQHYAHNMSDVFFRELQIPIPLYNIKAGSGSHGVQTAIMIKGIEEILLKEKPDAVILYGDTNTTIAGALAASKIGIPIVHIEAGLRSFNKKMPEEINRITCDHMSSLLFVPTRIGMDNLTKEGFSAEHNDKASIDHPHIYQCGDIMYDNSLYLSQQPQCETDVLERNNLSKNEYILCTVHRDHNTDDTQRLTGILSALQEVQGKTGLKIMFPAHPRTQLQLKSLSEEPVVRDFLANDAVRITEPLGVFDIVQLEKNARIIATDSGGLQKEAYFFKKPCVILREQTEWVEIVQNGNAMLAGADPEKITAAMHQLLSKNDYTYPPLFGDGKAGDFICSKISSEL